MWFCVCLRNTTHWGTPIDHKLIEMFERDARKGGVPFISLEVCLGVAEKKYHPSNTHTHTRIGVSLVHTLGSVWFQGTPRVTPPLFSFPYVQICSGMPHAL